MAAAASIVLLAGGMTFVNEWYQTGEVNWRVPVATLLGAAAIDGLSNIDRNVGLGLSVMVLIAASTTRFNGKSVIETVGEVFATKRHDTRAHKTQTRQVA